MDNYSKVLEFFMENNIILNSDQMSELKDICETSITKKVDNVGNVIVRNDPKGKEYMFYKDAVDDKGYKKVTEKDKDGKYTDKYMNPKDAKFIIDKAKSEKD